MKIEGEGQEEEGRKERWLRRREGYLVVWSQPGVERESKQRRDSLVGCKTGRAAEKRWTAAGIYPANRKRGKGEEEEKKTNKRDERKKPEALLNGVWGYGRRGEPEWWQWHLGHTTEYYYVQLLYSRNE